MPKFLSIRSLAVVLFLFGLGLPLAARADTGWLSLKGNPDYADVQAQLQVLVNIDGFHANNEFCLVGIKGYDYDDAIVY